MSSENIILLRNNIMNNIGKALNILGVTKTFSMVGKVAIKLHMGEYGNVHYIRPPIAGKLAQILKELGNSPFLFDTPTYYAGSRDTPAKYLETARKNGFFESPISFQERYNNRIWA
jgi:hypothetical protein